MADSSTAPMELDETGGGKGSDLSKTLDLSEKFQEIEEEKRQIEDGTHPAFKAKEEALRKVKDRRIFAADRFKQMQIDNIKGLYDYEVLEAEAAFKASMDDLRARMIESLETRIKKLEEDRERVLKQLERAGQTRVLRSKVFRPEEHDASTVGGPTRGNEPDGLVGVTVFLNDSEIKDDLLKIQHDLTERSKTFYNAQAAESMVDVSVEDGCLHYGNHCLLKGESISFTSMLSGEDFFGRIDAIRPNEILVKLTDGTKGRIYISYLKNGRIKLHCDDLDGDA